MSDQPYSNRELDAKILAIDEKFDDILEYLGRIETQTTKTNGRVTALELERARQSGFYKAMAIAGAVGWAVAVGLAGWTLYQVANINATIDSKIHADSKVEAAAAVANVLSGYNIQVTK